MDSERPRIGSLRNGSTDAAVMNLLSGCFRQGARASKVSPLDSFASIRDSYELIRSIGHGAKSEVLLGRCRQTGRLFALKFSSISDGAEDVSVRTRNVSLSL